MKKAIGRYSIETLQEYTVANAIDELKWCLKSKAKDINKSYNIRVYGDAKGDGETARDIIAGGDKWALIKSVVGTFDEQSNTDIAKEYWETLSAFDARFGR